ncbi:Rho termination factor N-terminal domain-containing protein [Paenibacillus sp. FSL L8-0323]|uniref:Rho termination factor N-terminal domain-containing protein n=1 Tax=unclassified Paenibacillus TaxID=185978 RepID=UPI0030FCEA72
MDKYEVVTPVLQGGVIFTSGEIELDDIQAKRLLELGAIAGEIPEEVKELEDMSGPELKAYAKKRDIDLGGATKKEDILAEILKAGGSDGGTA